jgi:hypothetical protein
MCSTLFRSVVLYNFKLGKVIELLTSILFKHDTDVLPHTHTHTHTHKIIVVSAGYEAT